MCVCVCVLSMQCTKGNCTCIRGRRTWGAVYTGELHMHTGATYMGGSVHRGTAHAYGDGVYAYRANCQLVKWISGL